MIGAGNSAMSGFAPSPSMYDIGYNGSAGGAISNALRQTIAKYDAHMSAQSEQQNKLAQIKAQGVASHPFMYNEDGTRSTGGSGSLTDANGPKITKDPTTGKFFYGNDSLNSSTGQVNTSWTPVTNSPPMDEKKILENSIYGALNAGMQGQNTPIFQGANGAVADNTGQQTTPAPGSTPPGTKKQINTKTGEIRYVPIG